MNWSIKKLKRMPNWLVWTLLVSIAFVILIFNDVFGENELFGVFAFFYFMLLIFLLSRWIFLQITSIIKLKNEKAQTELLHLKSQVNPHFFFNTLNNLYGMMEKDSKEREMVLKLSDMMRYSIYEGEKDWVSLEDELNYLKNYIELQEIRYHKKSDVQFSHEIENPQASVMPLLFIILVENAFKHGLENLEKNAYIHMHLTESKNEVNFTIENNFENQGTQNTVGIGLKNLKRRLELVYPNAHTLKFDITNNVYSAKLSLKLK